MANSLVFDGEQIPVADDQARIRPSIELPSVESPFQPGAPV
jgi:hypothetical protein